MKFAQIPMNPYSTTDRWTDLGHVGAGVYSYVRRAYDSKLKRIVAIKYEPVSYEVKLQKRAASMGISPAVIAETPNYFVMDYISGGTLEQYQMTPQIRSDLGCIGAILDTLKIRHQDLHRGNIVIDKTGKPMVIDYGVAVGVGEKGANLTELKWRYSVKEPIDYAACVERYRPSEPTIFAMQWDHHSIISFHPLATKDPIIHT